MKTNLDSIYKNMKPKELAMIAFTAIGKEDEGTLNACYANVPHKKYVGCDLDYSRTLQNQIDFSIYAGLQFHRQTLRFLSVVHIQRENIIENKRTEMDDTKWVQELMKQDRIFDNENMKYRIILTLINSLCDKYKIDKKTCLSFAEIGMAIDVLEATKEVEPEFWSDEVKTYHDDMKFILETTINPDANDDDKN